MKDTFYDTLGEGYDTLYGQEQEEKYQRIFSTLPCEKGWRVLDVGHATGRICEWLSACDVLGIDLAAELLKASPCKTRVHDMNQRFPFPDNSFDLVLCITAFHHARDPHFTLREMLRVARRRVIISLHTRLASTQRLGALLLSEGFSSFSAGVDRVYWSEKE